MDNLSSPLLRLFAPSIITVGVTHLINYFISVQSIPTNKWKSSNIIHVHKKGSKSEKSNYCPVSIWLHFQEFLRRLFLIRCWIAPLLSQKLSGFLKGHSCYTAISLKMKEGWRAVVAVDLSKAFDRVNLNLLLAPLLAKLKAYGFCTTATNLICRNVAKV